MGRYGTIGLLVLVAVSMVALLAIILLARMIGAQRRRQRDLMARAKYEDDLWAHGDDHGLYGEYPPDGDGRVPELEPSVPPFNPQHPSPTSELEERVRLERVEAARRNEVGRRAASQRDVLVRQRAARGRALIDQFLAMMHEHDVPALTVFQEHRGPTSITWDAVVGEGWPIGSGGKIGAGTLEGWRPLRAGQTPAVQIFFLPGVGFTKVRRVRPGQREINVIVYASEPDDSDEAFSGWADRESDLACSARLLIDRA